MADIPDPQPADGEPAIVVRLAEPTTDDIIAVADQLYEMDRHYNEPISPPLAAYQRFVETLVLAPGSGALVALAALEGPDLPRGIVGSAFFGVVYPADPLRGTVFVKDLFVAREARNRGVGAALMRFVARIAKEMGCSRLELTTGRDNIRARAFYDRLGGTVDHGRVFYQIKGDALDALARDGD